MGEYREYVCDNCGWRYINKDDVFMINENHEVTVAPLLISTSEIMQYMPVTGYYGEYYCYNCGKVVKEFYANEVWKNTAGFDDDEIIKYIENYDDSLKLIESSDKIQKCITCGKHLDLNEKRIKYFVLTENNELEIIDESSLSVLDAVIMRDNIKYKFLGKYYDYFCRDCRKQINKLIIIRNPDNLNENEIKDILNNHISDLTIHLENTTKSCPECGDELGCLTESSKCPKCGKGKLKLECCILTD